MNNWIRNLFCIYLGILGPLAQGLFATVARSQGPDKLAILVAVRDYEQPEISNLVYPEIDARSLADFLVTHGYEVKLLLGKQATKNAIKQALNECAGRGGNEGVVFLGVFGHGIESDRTNISYFCPFDASLTHDRDADNNIQYQDQRPRVALDVSSLVPIDDFLIALRESKAPNRILVADCCREDVNRARGRSFGSLLETNQLPKNAAVFFACSENEQAYEHDDWGHGAFTKCLLDQLRQGKSLMGSLAEEVAPAVEQLVRAKRLGTRGKQTPRLLSTGARVDLLLEKLEFPGEEDFQFGIALYRGIEDTIDLRKAVRFFERAAKQGHPLACGHLALDYHGGWGGKPRDLIQAIEWMNRGISQLHALAERGDAEAMFVLGMAYREGLGVVPNEERARQYLESSYRGGNIYAIVEMGSMYESSDPEKAFQLYFEGSRKGDPYATGALAYAYLLGVGTRKDQRRFLELAEESQQRGNPWIGHTMAHYYEENNATTQDLPKAFRMMERVFIDEDNAYSARCFSEYLFEGIGTTPDPIRGLDILTEGAKTDLDCLAELIRRIEEGDKVQKNLPQAQGWRRYRFQKVREAAELGHANSMMQAAILSLNGDGVEASSNEAFRWMIRHAILTNLTNGYFQLLQTRTNRTRQNKDDQSVPLVSIDDAIRICGQLQDTYGGPVLERIIAQLLLTTDSRDTDAIETIRAQMEKVGSSLVMANHIAWDIYENNLAAVKANEELRTILIQGIKKSLDIDGEMTDMRANALDTLAHLYDAGGDIALAIRTQREAVKLSNDKRLKDYLEELKDRLLND
ncbi:caspase family protein [Pirellulaceae bacterium SH449]